MTEFAYVISIFGDYNYVYGAIILCHSLRLTKTKYDIVCLITNDLSTYKDLLLTVFNKVVEVPYITRETNYNFKTKKSYQHWINNSYTKWNCLALVEYKKIIILDCDQIVFSNIDHLFELNAPAAICECYNKKLNSIISWGDGDKLHGDIITSNVMYNALLTEDKYLVMGSILLIEPKPKLLEKYLNWLPKVYGEDRIYNNPDVASYIEFIHLSENKPNWTNLSPRYSVISWHLPNITTELPIYMMHFYGSCPWNKLITNTWTDYTNVFKFIDNLLINNNQFRKKYLEYNTNYVNIKYSFKQRCLWCHNKNHLYFKIINNNIIITCPKFNNI